MNADLLAAQEQRLRDARRILEFGDIDKAVEVLNAYVVADTEERRYTDRMYLQLYHEIDIKRRRQRKTSCQCAGGSTGRIDPLGICGVHSR